MIRLVAFLVVLWLIIVLWFWRRRRAAFEIRPIVPRYMVCSWVDDDGEIRFASATYESGSWRWDRDKDERDV